MCGEFVCAKRRLPGLGLKVREGGEEVGRLQGDRPCKQLA